MSETAASPPPPAVDFQQGCCCRCAYSGCILRRLTPSWHKTGQQRTCRGKRISENKKNLCNTSQGNCVSGTSRFWLQFLTFLGGGGGFCANASFTASAADSGSLFSPFLESVSDRTTKKWWHFSHFTNRVDATTRTTHEELNTETFHIVFKGNLYIYNLFVLLLCMMDSCLTVSNPMWVFESVVWKVYSHTKVSTCVQGSPHLGQRSWLPPLPDPPVPDSLFPSVTLFCVNKRAPVNCKLH